jgi:hypothetical protein
MKAILHKHAAARMIPRLVWAGAVLTAIAGAVVGVGGTVAMNGPPHEDAAIALAYLVVIAPYVFVARAVDDLLR